MSTYDPNIPTGLVDLDTDYLNLQKNFEQLNTSFFKNHIPLTDATVNNGKHNYVEMPNTTLAAINASPGGPLVAFEGTLYTKKLAGTTELFFTRGASGVEVQLTGPGAPSAAGNGYTFLPGGLLIQWGLKASPGSSGTITFATANIAFPNNLFNVQLTVSRTSTSGGSGVIVIDSAATFDKTTFSYISSTAGSAGLYWIAIGN